MNSNFTFQQSQDSVFKASTQKNILYNNKKENNEILFYILLDYFIIIYTIITFLVFFVELQVFKILRTYFYFSKFINISMQHIFYNRININKICIIYIFFLAALVDGTQVWCQKFYYNFKNQSLQFGTIFNMYVTSLFKIVFILGK